MKLRNDTHWDTKHLRAIIARVVADELEPKRRRHLIVRVKYNRQRDRGYVSGHCVLGWLRPVIMVPSQTVDRIDLAHTVAHELAHAKGWHHRDFSGQSRYNRVGAWRELYAWAESMPLEKQAPKPKARPAVGDKLDHARRMMARWQSKQKRATTGVRAWARRVRYYERKQAACRPETTPSRETS